FQMNFNGDLLSDRKKVLSIIFYQSSNSLAQKVSNILEEFTSLYNYEYLGQIQRGQTHLVDLIPKSIFKTFGLELDFHTLGFELVSNNTLDQDLVNRIQRNLTPEDSVLKEIFSAYRLI
ncbi:MAG: hypothetical protein ACK42Z_05195, partial [Candidatus Kapaibacteriota bacterium]